MKRKKVVCFVNHTAETGGAEFALFRLIEALDRRVWHPVALFGEEGNAVEYLRSKSVECYVIPLDEIVGKARRKGLNGASIKQCIASLQYVWRLFRFLKERAVEIVHTNSMKAHVLGGAAARMAGIPLVWHLRDSFHIDCLPRRALMVMRFLARVLPNKLVTVSKSVAIDALGKNDSWRARVIYDGLENDCFQNVPENTEYLVAGASWTVGIAGRLSRWKGQHLFLEAAERLLGRGVEVQFEILGGPLFGEDAYAAELLEFVSARGLNQKISFKGFVKDVTKRIKEWDILVHASTAPDPCPNVVIEAMASGVPVVGAAGGGVPELLENGRCGVLFPMDDPEALSVCIEKLLRDVEKRREISKLAYERSLHLFRSERVAREVEAEWNNLFDEKNFENRRWPWVEDGFPRLNPRKVFLSLSSKTKLGLGKGDGMASTPSNP